MLTFFKQSTHMHWILLHIFSPCPKPWKFASTVASIVKNVWDLKKNVLYSKVFQTIFQLCSWSNKKGGFNLFKGVYPYGWIQSGRGGGNGGSRAEGKRCVVALQGDGWQRLPPCVTSPPAHAYPVDDSCNKQYPLASYVNQTNISLSIYPP